MKEGSTATHISGHDLKVEINGVTVNYDDCGQGETPIIFIHGFPFNKTMWKPQATRFSATHRVITYDIRGFGKSTNISVVPSINLYADDLIKFMDALNIRKAIVCGLSMGGYILQNAVSIYPDRFAALILADTQCIGDTQQTREKRYKAMIEVMATGPEDFAEGLLKQLFAGNTYQNNRGVIDDVRDMIMTTSAKTITGTLGALAQRWDTCSHLERISMPVQIICGKEDKLTPIAESEFLHEHIPHSRLCIIPNAGHVSNMEQPEAFNKCVQEFLITLPSWSEQAQRVAKINWNLKEY